MKTGTKTERTILGYPTFYNNFFCSFISGAITNVRRSFYPPDSPAGKGARWEWEGDVHGEWHAYDMQAQCLIEYSWAKVSLNKMK